MARTIRTAAATVPVVLAAVALSVLVCGACSSDDDGRTSQVVADGATCDKDPSTAEAQTINEDVGGLQTDGFVVRFAESTRLGTVALVEGDVATAYRRLHDDYGVTAVAAIRDDGSARVTGFAQVRELVDEACPPAGG